MKNELGKKDRVDAETMNLKAVETLGQTSKRMCGEKRTSKPVKRRSKGSDAVSYFRDKNEAMNEWRKEEFELKRVKLESYSRNHDKLKQIMLPQQQMQEQQHKQH